MIIKFKLIRELLKFCCIILLFNSCSTTDHVNYSIQGKWAGGDNRIVWLQYKEGKDSIVIIDSTKVFEGKFLLEGSVPFVRKCFLVVDQPESFQEVILDGEPINANITISKNDNNGGLTIDISGSREQKLIVEGRYALLFTPTKEFTTLIPKDSIVNAGGANKLLTFLQNNNNTYAALYTLVELVDRNFPLTNIELYLGMLAESIRESEVGRQLKERIAGRSNISKGNLAPDISLPDKDGEIIKLSSLKGKYVILDFWASWCGPCLREIPNLIELYEQYKGLGLEIYSISLDNQAQRSNWLDAIEKHEMDWIHVSSLKGWGCPIVELYNVTAVPSIFIINPEGRFEAIKVRGEELKEVVSLLF